MKKRTALGMVTAVALLAGCSSSTVITQVGLHAQMESGPAINSSSGRYRAGTAEIALTKIVSLPDAQLGFRFVVSAPSLRGGCCSSSGIALAGQTDVPSSDGTYEIDLAENLTSVASDGTIDLRLFGGSPEHALGTFRLRSACTRRASLAPYARDTYPGYSSGSSTNTGICRSVFV